VTRLLIIDDHAIVRAGVRRLLAASPQIDCVEAATGEAALRILAQGAIDVALLDLGLPGLGGVELIRCLLRDSPRLRILVFSTHAEPIYVARSLEAGALGYVSKTAAPEDLARGIHALLRGRTYVEAGLDAAGDGEDPPGEAYLRPLTDRELEIVRLLARGRSLNQIAQALGVAYKTIANTCTRIKDKLGVTHTADLIRISIDQGLV
jgi:DNA-binding NarL/FixJ family response regulator